MQAERAGIAGKPEQRRAALRVANIRDERIRIAQLELAGRRNPRDLPLPNSTSALPPCWSPPPTLMYPASVVGRRR